MQNPENEELRSLEIQYKIALELTRKGFINGLIIGTIQIILWTVIAHFIPPNNWRLAFNIIMVLLSLWIIAFTSYEYFKLRIPWGWLRLILTGITWTILVNIVKWIVELFFASEMII